MTGDDGPITQRSAIVHDWFQGFHGSERVVEAMLTDVFADVETVDVFTFHAAREVLPRHLADAIVGESRLARLPALRQRGHEPGRWRYLLPYMPRYFRGLDLSAYDVVVASSHSCAVHVRPRAGATFVCYCYTPMRYAWMPELEGQRVAGVQGRVLRALRAHLRRQDRAAAQAVGRYATLSSAVAGRISAFYGRDAEVIAPPVDVQDFALDDSRREPGHFLWVHRFVSYKRPELVVEAFRDSPHRLTMVGVGPLQERIRKIAPDNVTIHGWLDRSELTDLFARASGFIHVGEEDFGISMVEALAAGVPVLAYDAGGARDIVRRRAATGCSSRARPTRRRSARGVRKRGRTREWKPQALRQSAERFSEQSFREQLAARSCAPTGPADSAPGGPSLNSTHHPARISAWRAQSEPCLECATPSAARPDKSETCRRRPQHECPTRESAAWRAQGFAQAAVAVRSRVLTILLAVGIMVIVEGTRTRSGLRRCRSGS